MSRNQLPPQIKKVELERRENGKPVYRYQLTVDTGVVDGKRKQYRKRFNTEAAARKELSAIQANVAAGTYVQASTITVASACTDWLASKHGLKPSTLRGHKSKLATVELNLGTIEIQKLTKADLDRLVQQLRAGKAKGCKKPWSARSVNYMLYLTYAVLESELKQGHVIRNVASLVDRLPSEREEMKTLTEAQMFKIFDHECRDRHLWTLALYGFRRGEMAGLKWEHVNFTAKTVTIVENRVAAGNVVYIGSPKSKKSRRVLPMPPDMEAALRAAHKRQVAERLSCADYQASGYVACYPDGRAYSPNLITYRWGKLLDELGIARVRLHDARHSCGTLMHLRGVPTAVIAAWLGHASAAFTLATYVHSQDDALVTAAQSFRPVVTTRDNDAADTGTAAPEKHLSPAV